MNLFPKNKKGQVGLDLVTKVVIGFLTLVVIAIAMMLATTSLTSSGIFATNSLQYNQSTQMAGNVSAGLLTFFGSASTVFSVLLATVIVLTISIIILAIRGFGNNSTGL